MLANIQLFLVSVTMALGNEKCTNICSPNSTWFLSSSHRNACKLIFSSVPKQSDTVDMRWIFRMDIVCVDWLVRSCCENTAKIGVKISSKRLVDQRATVVCQSQNWWNINRKLLEHAHKYLVLQTTTICSIVSLVFTHELKECHEFVDLREHEFVQPEHAVHTR